MSKTSLPKTSYTGLDRGVGCPRATNGLRLTALDLSLNGIEEEGAKALTQSPYLHELTTLDLSFNGIGDDGLKMLTQSAHMASLTTLDLSFNGIGEEGAKALAQSPYLQGPNLKRVGWSCSGSERHFDAALGEKG